jgi:metallo-beta-lactamase family protein
MKVTFWGAARTVTGSRHLITTTTGKNILLDAGLFQGKEDEQQARNRVPGFLPEDIDAVILTHAHIDHSGFLPALYAQGFRGKIYATDATKDLCEIMLVDSAHIQEEDAKYDNKRRVKAGKTLREPIYNQEDARKVMTLFRTKSYHETFTVWGLECHFFNTGHLLGSAGIYLQEQDISLVFTGDLGRKFPSMLQRPDPLPASDYLICESTYGDRLHEDYEFTLKALLDVVNKTCIQKRGKLLIPAFSIGRTQEILFALDYLSTFDLLPNVPVFVDSPLSTKGTKIFKAYLPLFNEEIQAYLKKDPDPFQFTQLHFVENVEESKAINNIEGPCIIISSSGMMEAGRIRHHLFNHISDPKTTILMTGYAEPSTLGGRLLHQPDFVRILGKYLPVRAEVHLMKALSGHADRQELLDAIPHRKEKPYKGIFLVHGDYDAQLSLKDGLEEKGVSPIHIPTFGHSYFLD